MSFRKIFTHTDNEGDHLEVAEAQADRAGELAFNFITLSGSGGVFFTHDRAASLHAVLGEWLYPVHTPEGPNRSLIEQMIERAVKDQVAAVLPLHLKTVGEYVANYGRGPEAIQPQRDDPEPRDVGHPTYEDARPHPTAPECGKCGALWSDTHGQPGDPCAPAPSAPAPAGPTWDDELWGATSAEAGARTLPVPVCTECGHSWPRHPLLNVAKMECSVRGCGCTRVRP